MRKRNHGIFFRLSDDEFIKLQELLNATGFSLAEFFRFNFLKMKQAKNRISKTLDSRTV